MDYIHYNPVKHGYVDNPVVWTYSSVQRAIKQGLNTPGWGEVNDASPNLDVE